MSEPEYLIGWAGLRWNSDNIPSIIWGNGTPTTGGPNATITVADYNGMLDSLISESDPVEDDYERDKERLNEGFSEENPSPVGLLPEDRFADAKAAREAKGKENHESARPQRKGEERITEP